MRRDQAEDIIANERKRQIEREGWTPEHDDGHDDGELLRAAVIYLHHASPPHYHGEAILLTYDPNGVPMGWPWEPRWWKPKDRLRDLARAGALCLAERDRIERRAQRKGLHAYTGHVMFKYDLVVSALMN